MRTWPPWRPPFQEALYRHERALTLSEDEWDPVDTRIELFEAMDALYRAAKSLAPPTSDTAGLPPPALHVLRNNKVATGEASV